jgi:hypothetical protein
MSTIALKLNNDLSVPVSINVLGGAADESNQNNADTFYEWDLSTETFLNVDTVLIQVRFSGQTLYQTLSTFISNLTVQGVADALSTFNVGNFLALNNIVYTYNSDIEFGQLSLTLSNVPNIENIIFDAYEYFVPAGTTLRSLVYPSLDDFRSDWLSSLELLLNQTNAGPLINLYGVGCLMPLFTSAPSVSGSITMTAPSPKAANLRPILSTSIGVSQGYILNFTTSDTNAWLLLPSGDASEITQINWSHTPYYVFYHSTSIFSALTTLTHSSSEVRLSTDGMLDTLTTLTDYNSYPYSGLTYPDTWVFPSINSAGINFITLDGPGVVPLQTLSTNSDFFLSAIPLNRFLIESFDNILVNPTLGLSLPSIKTFFIQFSSNVVFGPNVNTLFDSNLPNASSSFNVGFSNSLVSWQDTTTPLQLNGFNSIILNQIDLSDFPPILTMNYFENSTTDFLLNLNLSGNNLLVATVNQILIDLDNTSTGKTSFSGTINLSGQIPPAAPTGLGITAKNNLIANGMTVITD